MSVGCKYVGVDRVCMSVGCKYVGVDRVSVGVSSGGENGVGRVCM